jgi:PIN domain
VSSSPDLVPLPPTRLLPDTPFDGWVSFGRVPAVVDASALINDCLRYVRLGREPLLLYLARQPVAVNLYATCAVGSEVEERLPRAVATVGLPLGPVERVWHEELRPLVSFVEAGALRPSSDPRALELALRHPPDLPTVALAELLGPCLVFANDKDLVDLGLARNDWANLLLHARDVSAYQTGASLSVFGTILVGALSVEFGKGLVGAARRWPLPSLLVGLAGGYFLYAYWQSERGVGQRRDARSFAVEAGRDLSVFIGRALDARDLLERAAFIPEREPTPLSAVARLVASAPRPLRPGEIGGQLGYTPQRVTSILQAPVFERTSEGYYLLGRRG